MGKAGEDYECAQCGETFQRVTDDDDPALAQEQFENFGIERDGSEALVCDDCYKEILKHYRFMIACQNAGI